MTEIAIKELGACQVRSGTAQPCDRPADLKLRGVPFCERCAREQEAYFAIGEFTEAEERDGGDSLAVVMDLMKKLRLRHQRVRGHEPDAA